MAYIKFDVDFISTNDDLAEYAHEMANQARTDFLIFFPSYKHISKALQKCMKSNLAFKAFHSIFLLLLVGFFSHYSLSSIIHSMWSVLSRLRIFGFSKFYLANSKTKPVKICARAIKNKTDKNPEWKKKWTKKSDEDSNVLKCIHYRDSVKSNQYLSLNIINAI